MLLWHLSCGQLFTIVMQHGLTDMLLQRSGSGSFAKGGHTIQKLEAAQGSACSGARACLSFLWSGIVSAGADPILSRLSRDTPSAWQYGPL